MTHSVAPGAARTWLIADERIAVDKTGSPLLVDLSTVAETLVYTVFKLTADADSDQVALAREFALPAGGQWVSLRQCLGCFSESEFVAAGRALQIAHWWHTHQFCSMCARALEGPASAELGRLEFVRRCNHCSMSFYPRLSPCVIVLISRGDQCLLAYHKRARSEIYTTLAGFIEPGESVEETVHREVAEEVGLQVTGLRYVDSQSWPFPGQLMLGFYAEYAAGELVLQADEIVDAQWFRYDALPAVPPAGTIARRLIDGFVDACKSAEST